MIVYAYQAALYCEDCGRAIRKRLKADGKKPSDDSDEWPIAGGGESDCPEHCDSGEHCLNAIVLSDRLIGAWLENPLTSYGVEYVREVIAQGDEVAELWEQWYSDEL